jgi:hypothetical protein
MTKKLVALSISIWISTMTGAYADTNQVVKEDTTPPAAEAALTVDRIPPIDSKTYKVIPMQTQMPEPAAAPESGGQANDSTSVRPQGQ